MESVQEAQATESLLSRKQGILALQNQPRRKKMACQRPIHQPHPQEPIGRFENLLGTGKMVQWWLRAMAAVAENPGSIPSTYMVAHNHL
jgi:hypothetical protein